VFGAILERYEPVGTNRPGGDGIVVSTGDRRNIMWARGIIGLVLCVLGGVWIFQGTGVLHGSYMTGRSQYAVLGAVALALGLGLLAWAVKIRLRPVKSPG
jgi:hypothetical protein